MASSFSVPQKDRSQTSLKTLNSTLGLVSNSAEPEDEQSPVNTE